MKSIVFRTKLWPLHALILLSAAAACSGKADSGAAIYKIDGSDAAAQARAMTAAGLSASQSAEALVEWLAAAPLNGRDFASALTRELAGAYDTGGANRFLTALDSVVMTRDDKTRARIFAAGSIPEGLAASLREQKADSAFIGLVAEAYSSDSTLHRRFLNAVNRPE